MKNSGNEYVIFDINDNKQIFDKVKWDIRSYSVELAIISIKRVNNSDVPSTTHQGNIVQ